MVTDTERRNFLKKVIQFSFGLIGIALVPFYFYLKPSKYETRKKEFFYVTTEDNLPKRGVKKFEISLPHKTMRIYVVRQNDELIALSPVCTHLGCLVNWNRNINEFQCSCHGGRYGMDGTVLGGPPPAPLTRLPIEFREDKLYVGLELV